jgi:nicotinate-nucleotide pyrophosphorylase (carboxylating)
MDPSAFLKADVGRFDLTSRLDIPDSRSMAHIICCEDAVVAGIDEASDVFSYLEGDAEPLAKEGDRIRAGSRVMSVSGPVAKILAGERTALGFLSIMSGIATCASDAVRAVDGKIRVAAIPSIPGFSGFEMKAVAIGGGDPHASGLDSIVFLRREHISVCGSVRNAMERVSKASVAVKKAIEVVNAQEAADAAEGGADIIRALDLGPEGVADVFDAAKKVSDRIIVEACGGITAENIADYVGRADVAILDRAQRPQGPVVFKLCFS